MRVAHFSKSAFGGAGRAMVALSEALRAEGVDSFIVTLDADAGHPARVRLEAGTPDTLPALASHALRENFTTRTSVSNTLFSFDYPGFALLGDGQFDSVDLFHFHWIVEEIDIYALRDLVTAGKRVIVTLHDMWPFTGGCHYSMGCRRFEEDCSACPQLVGPARNLPGLFQRLKAEAFADPRIIVTSPSAWLSQQSLMSLVFAGHPHRVVRNCVNLSAFHPAEEHERMDARAAIGAGADDLVLVVVSQTFGEARKGYSFLRGALMLLQQQRPDLLSRILLLCIGYGSDSLSGAPVRLYETGNVDEDAAMRRFYGAGDFLIQPALEENYSNVILEAMACGLPGLVSDVGGNPELIEHGLNGLVFNLAGGGAALAEAIAEAAELAPDARRGFIEAGVARAAAHGPGLIAKAFLAIYGDEGVVSAAPPLPAVIAAPLHHRWSAEKPLDGVGAALAIPYLDALTAAGSLVPAAARQRATDGVSSVPPPIETGDEAGLAPGAPAEVESALIEPARPTPDVDNNVEAVRPPPETRNDAPVTNANQYALHRLTPASSASAHAFGARDGGAYVEMGVGPAWFAEGSGGASLRLEPLNGAPPPPQGLAPIRLQRPGSLRRVTLLTPPQRWSADPSPLVEGAFHGWEPRPYRLGLTLDQGGRLMVRGRRVDGPDYFRALAGASRGWVEVDFADIAAPSSGLGEPIEALLAEQISAFIEAPKTSGPETLDATAVARLMIQVIEAAAR